MRTFGSKDKSPRQRRGPIEMLNGERVYSIRGQKNGRGDKYGIIYLPEEFIGSKVFVEIIAKYKYDDIKIQDREYFKSLKGGKKRMAISRESFVKGGFKRTVESTSRENHPIMKFLRKNHRNAFTVLEITKVVKLSEEGVRGMLRSLEKQGLVEHKSPYYLVKLNGSKKKAKKSNRK